MADEDSQLTDSSVLGEEGHSDSLRVAAESRVGLSKPAKATILFVGTRLFAKKCLTATHKSTHTNHAHQ